MNELSDALKVAIVGGIFSFLVAIVPELIRKNSGLKDDIVEIKKAIQGLKKDTSMNSDMIYQMLDHMATDNNTGQMKRALDEYNEYNRKN